jgi:hypothetical protein
MKSELDTLWETPPKKRATRQHSIVSTMGNPKLEKELLDLLDGVLERFPNQPRPKEWIIKRMVENLIGHITKYRSFTHSESYIIDVVLSTYGEQVKLLTKRSMASWNKGRKFSYRIDRMIENNPHL